MTPLEAMQPSIPPPRQLGTIGIISLGWFLAAVLALNLIDSDFSPIKNMISEYSNGNYGWLMQSAFLGAGIGTVAIALGLRKTLQPGRLATVSTYLLFAAGLGFFLAIEKNGWLHLIGSVIVFFTILLAAWMTRSAFRRDPSWQALAKTQTWYATTYTIALIALFGTLDGPGGLVQRITVLVMMTWLITLADNIQSNHRSA